MKRKYFFLLICFLIMATFQLSGQTCTPPSGYSLCYQITRTDDANVAGTLRYAITQANLNTGGTYITFNLAATSGGQAVIQLTSELPTIVKKVMVDGTSNVGSIPVVIQGTKTIATGMGMSAGSSNSTIKGVIIRTFAAQGIWIHPWEGSYINNISILSNTVYDIGYSNAPGIRLDQYLQSCNIYGNILGGYLDNNNQPVRDVSTNIIPLYILSVSPGNTGAPLNVYLSNINVGDGTKANSNIFFSGQFSIYIGFGGNGTCATKKITGVSIKYNIINPLYLTLDGRSNPVYVEASCGYNYNNAKKAPVISKFDVYTKTLIGTSSPGDRVEVYMDVPVINGNYNSVPYAPTAVKYLGVTYANGLGNWTLPQSSWADPVTPIKDYDVFSAVADSLSNSSIFTNYMHFACPVMDITLPSVVCKNSPAFIVTGTPTGGTFSSLPTPPTISGNNSTTITPSALSAGTVYTITYQLGNPPVALTSRGCPTTVSKKILVPPSADTLTRVINISAGTSNDAWPIDGSVLSSTIGYGTSGIKYMWAPEEQYAYVDDRIQSNTLKTRTDGLLKGVPMFNWKNMASNSCYANWRKVNTITQINSGTGQLENKDILNNYSAALYGYNDQLSTAVASNASYKEVAFDSFEEYATGSAGLNLTTLPKSNLTIVTSDPSANLSQQVSFSYPITEGTDNTIVIQYPYDYTKLYNKQVGIFGASVENFGLKNIQGYYNVLTSVQGIVPGTVKLTLDEFSYTGFWTGKITIPSSISDASSNAKFTVPANANSIVNAFPSGIQRRAHSGQQFLKVTANTEMEQVSMKLTPSRKYVVSAWVSTDDADSLTYVRGATGTDRRIEITFLDAAGLPIVPAGSTDYMFTPSGLIIEGWQRLEGTVTVPANAARFTLKFITPTGTATYFDDVRVFPFDGNMQSYVYNKYNYKLVSVLDQNNYATYYYYNEEGALYLVKKETEAGVQTLQEVYHHATEITK